MAIETVKSRSAALKLENGTDSEGNMKYVTSSYPRLQHANWDADKIVAIAAAVAPCLSKTISTVESTTTSTVAAQ